MKHEHIDQYITAVKAAYHIRRLCDWNAPLGKKMYDTVLDQDDRSDFYRRFEDIVEAAQEVGGNGRFFMCLIRTLEILYIMEYWRPNARGLELFCHLHGNLDMPVDLLNLVNALISKSPDHNHQIEKQILVIALMA